MEKSWIAREAVSMVDDGGAIMLCGGTTTQALAQLLVGKRLMVATNSVLVAQELASAKEVEVLVIGGILRGSIHALVGEDAEKTLARMHFAKLFRSGNGLSAERGLSTPNVHVASVDRAAADVSERVIAMVDHTKIGIQAMVQTVPTARISVLVTDDAADPLEVAALRAEAVPVRIAAAGHPPRVALPRPPRR